MKINKYTLVHITLAISSILMFKNCVNSPNGAIDLSPPLSEFNTDFYGLKLKSSMHLYKDDFKALLIKTNKSPIIVYCTEHYEYESISKVIKPDTTYYIVR